MICACKDMGHQYAASAGPWSYADAPRIRDVFDPREIDRKLSIFKHRHRYICIYICIPHTQTLSIYISAV